MFLNLFPSWRIPNGSPNYNSIFIIGLILVTNKPKCKRLKHNKRKGLNDRGLSLMQTQYVFRQWDRS